MRVTLPVSGKDIELASFDHKTGKDLYKKMSAVATSENYAQAFEAFMDERNSLLSGLYEARGLDLECLPHRDVVTLFNVTYDYNMGVKVAVIKNSLAGGDGALTASESTTAPTADESAADTAKPHSAKGANMRSQDSGATTGKP